MLGSREKSIYGSETLDSIVSALAAAASQEGVVLEAFQSNHEGALVEAIQNAPAAGFAGIVINPAAYGHTSIALRDALIACALPFVEVHISNTFAREEFRARTYLSDIAAGVVVGFGAASYRLGLTGLIGVIRAAAG